MGNLVANYFSIIFALLPALVFIQAWRENFLQRVVATAKRKGRSVLGSVLAACMLGGISSAFMLYMMYAAPGTTSDKPILYGQRIAYLMVNTEIGLLVFGSTGGIGAVLFLAFAYGVIQIPVLLVLRLFRS
jgi:hypothetical protein